MADWKSAAEFTQARDWLAQQAAKPRETQPLVPYPQGTAPPTQPPPSRELASVDENGNTVKQPTYTDKLNAVIDGRAQLDPDSSKELAGFYARQGVQPRSITSEMYLSGTDPGSLDEKKQLHDDIVEHRSRVNQLKQLYDGYKNQGQQLDLSPLLHLVDSWKGTKLAAGYKRPLTPEERQEHVLKFEDKIADAQKDVVGSQARAIASESNAEMNRQLGRQTRFEDIQLQTLSKAYGTHVPGILSTLDNLNKLIPGGINGNNDPNQEIPGYNGLIDSVKGKVFTNAAEAAVRRNMTQLLNSYVYLYSGKQINETEASRIMKGMGLDWPARPSDIRGALQELTKALHQQLKVIEAPYRGRTKDGPSVIDRFRQGGAYTSDDMFDANSNFRGAEAIQKGRSRQPQGMPDADATNHPKIPEGTFGNYRQNGILYNKWDVAIPPPKKLPGRR